MKKIFKSLLVIALFFVGLIFINATEDDRIVIDEVEITSNMEVPTYGGEVKNYYNYETVVGSPAYMTPHMGSWYVKNGDNWSKYTVGVFREGVYKYSNQIRIDNEYGLTHRLSEETTLKVDDEDWIISNNITIASTYSMIYYYSPEYEVEVNNNLELTFANSNSYIIPTNYVNQPITSYSVSESAIGGKGAYIFSKTSGPSWVNVSSDGTVSGTPLEVGTNPNLVIRVTDEENSFREITIRVNNTEIDPNDRETISHVEVTSNMEVPTYNGEVKNYYSYETVVGSPAYMTPHMGTWYYKNGDSWSRYDEAVFTEGTYKFSNQIRIDDEAGKTHKLSPDTTLLVDNVEWTLSSSVSIHNTYSMAYFDSPEYIVEKPNLTKPTVTISSNKNNISLNWSSQLIATHYIVYKSKDNKKWDKGTKVTSTTYNDKGLTYGKKYYYKVKACENNICGSNSKVVSKKVLPNKIKLTIKSAGTNNVKLTWTKENITGYEIYSSTDNKKWTKVTTITKNSTTEYNVKKLKSNKKYYFKARGYKTVSGKKVFGSYGSVVTTKTAPEKPVLILKVNDSHSLKFTLNSSKGAKYYIGQLADNKDFKNAEERERINEPLSRVMEFNPGKTIYIRVKACNSEDRCSGWSIVHKKVVPSTPKLTLSSKVTKKVNVKMTTSDIYVYGFEIYRSTSKNGKYELVKTITAETDTSEYNYEEVDENTFSIDFNNKTKKGKTYYYKVRCYTFDFNEKKVYGSYSKIKSIVSK